MRKVSTLVGLALMTLAGTALAQEGAPAEDVAPPPAVPADPAAAPAPEGMPVAGPEAAPAAPAAAGSDYISRGLTVGAGTLQVTVPVMLNLSKELVLKPVTVPLDVRFGVNDQLEVFLIHSTLHNAYGAGGMTPTGVCLGGKDRGCAKLYNNLSVGAQFSIMKDSAMELAAIGALDLRSLDPMHLAINVGVAFKYNANPIAIKIAPQISIGATKRDEGNKELLAVPVQIAFQASPELAAYLSTGIFGPTSKFADSFYMPVGVGASFAAMPNLDVGGEFVLPMIYTAWSGDKSFDARTLTVFASYRTN